MKKMFVIHRAADRSRKRTYTELMRAELGRVWEIVLQWCILLGNTGGMYAGTALVCVLRKHSSISSTVATMILFAAF